MNKDRIAPFQSIANAKSAPSRGMKLNLIIHMQSINEGCSYGRMGEGCGVLGGPRGGVALGTSKS